MRTFAQSFAEYEKATGITAEQVQQSEAGFRAWAKWDRQFFSISDALCDPTVVAAALQILEEVSSKIQRENHP